MDQCKAFEDIDYERIHDGLQNNVIFQIHTDGGVRHNTSAAAAWTLHSYSYRPESRVWSAELLAFAAFPLPIDTNSFVAEAIALEAAFKFVDGILPSQQF